MDTQNIAQINFNNEEMVEINYNYVLDNALNFFNQNNENNLVASSHSVETPSWVFATISFVDRTMEETGKFEDFIIKNVKEQILTHNIPEYYIKKRGNHFAVKFTNSFIDCFDNDTEIKKKFGINESNSGNYGNYFFIGSYGGFKKHLITELKECLARITYDEWKTALRKYFYPEGGYVRNIMKEELKMDWVSHCYLDREDTMGNTIEHKDLKIKLSKFRF